MLRNVVLGLDDLWCRTLLALRGDRPALLSFLLHAIRPPDDDGTMDRLVDPAQTLDTDALDRLIGTFRRAGYTFVAPDELATLDARGRYVFLTFDDGYHNNVHALPLLEKHSVPATFFISTRHVLEGRAFWWDVVYRERLKQGWSYDRIEAERTSLKTLPHDRIDAELEQRFGAAALLPTGAADRPLTPDELRAFAAHPRVHIGNHTAHHAILTNYDEAGAEHEIRTAQDDLEHMLGERPRTIAYPNGSYSDAVVRAAKRAGLEWGITLDPVRNPASDTAPMAVGRYCVTQGHATPSNLASYRAGLSLRRWVERRRHAPV